MRLIYRLAYMLFPCRNRFRSYMPTAARVVANEFIRLAQQEGRSLTPLELLKLVYIAHGYTLAGLGRPLVNEEIEAWRYGPVIPDLYQAMRRYGGSPVIQELPVPFYLGNVEPLDHDEVGAVNWVYEHYKKYNGINLSALTHADDTPWSITWASQGQNAVISPDLIQQHYTRLLADKMAP